MPIERDWHRPLHRESHPKYDCPGLLFAIFGINTGLDAVLDHTTAGLQETSDGKLKI